MTEEQYPYNQPPWRRSHRELSPDGKWTANISKAYEIFMSGPTKGTLCISDLFEIPDCSPTFVWSEDSRYLTIPQWKYFFRRRERLLVIDTQTKAIFASSSKFHLLDLTTFSDGSIKGVDSPIHNPREIEVSLDEVIKTYKRTIYPISTANRQF